MVAVIRMPSTLAGVTESAIQTWLVPAGAHVVVGDPLAELETEKAIVEFATEHDGRLVRILIEEGVNVDVGTPIAIIAGDEDTDAEIARAFAEAGVDASSDQALDSDQDTTDEQPQQVTMPAASARAESTETRLRATPLVRKLARQNGHDLTSVTGTGPAGRITRRDLERHVAAGHPDRIVSVLPVSEMPEESRRAPIAADGLGESPQTHTAVTTGTAHSDVGVEIPLSPMRRAIARRLTESKTTVPHFYMTRHCRVDALLELRQKLNDSSDRKISVNDLVVKAAAQALLSVPDANAVWNDGMLRRFDRADIAVAVAIDQGLLTPVVRDVGSLSMSSLSAAIKDLATRAREGRLKQSELEGGTLSISNLGMYGVDEFAAIINPPHAGILAVGAATERPIVENGEVVIATMMTLTLSGDHRVMDGATGATLLSEITARIEAPLQILV